MATRDLRSYFTSISKDKKASHDSCTSIPQLVKATGNAAAADASAVNAELESFSKKKERQGSSYNTNVPSRIKEEVGKYAHTYAHTYRLPLNALNQSTLTTLFYVRL